MKIRRQRTLTSSNRMTIQLQHRHYLITPNYHHLFSLIRLLNLYISKNNTSPSTTFHLLLQMFYHLHQSSTLYHCLQSGSYKLLIPKYKSYVGNSSFKDYFVLCTFYPLISSTSLINLIHTFDYVAIIAFEA